MWDEVSAGDKIERFVASVCHEEASQGISVGCKAEFRDLFLERVTKRYHFAPRDVVERSCADAEGQCGSLVLFELRFMELHNKSVLARYASEASSLRSRRDDALAEVRRDEEREAEERRAVAAMLRGVSAGLAAGAARTRSSVEPTLPMTYSASTEADPRIVVCSSDFACPYGQKCIKSQFSFEGVCVQPVDESGMRVITPPASSSIGLGQEGECSFTVECRLGFRCVKLGTDLRGHCLK
ncbi:MAG: hypothetical protein U0169_25965 [Polyangiaceae bacterium]